MKRFLVVDDSAFTRTIHRKLLANAGFDSIEADGPAPALQQLEQFSVDGLLVDLLMPDADGSALIKEVHEKRPELPILVCSSDKQQPRQQEVLQAGATVFIGKPLTADKLTHALAEVFGKERPHG